MNIKPVENYGAGLSGAAAELRVARAEAEMLKLPQADCPVVHRFGPGVYIRQVTLAADTYAIGHHQNFEHQNIVMSGRVTIINDDGSKVEIIAPAIFTGKPGRKVGYAHEETVWLNVYATDETDIEVLEKKYLTKSAGWLDDSIQRKERLVQISVDNDDYRRALEEFGFTDDVARNQSENADDMRELPHGGYKIMVSDSGIEGRGLFATSSISDGEVICPSRIGGMRTIGGRFTNHSASPNAIMRMLPCGDIDLVATKNIDGCHGGQNGEEITIDYRDALSLQVKRVEVLA